MTVEECLGVIKSMELEVPIPAEGQSDPVERKNASLWRMPEGQRISSSCIEGDERIGIHYTYAQALEDDGERVLGMGIRTVCLIPRLPQILAEDRDPNKVKLSVYPIGMITPKQATHVPNGMRIMGFLKSLMPGDFLVWHRGIHHGF